MAYGLASLLKRSFLAGRSATSHNEDATAAEEREQKFQAMKAQLQQELRDKLPPYIVRAIDYVTDKAEAPMGPHPTKGVQGADVAQSNQ